MTEPQGRLTINENATYTINTDVSLGLEFSDNFGVDKINLSWDGITWLGWITPKETYSFTLTEGDGEKEVYCKLKDLAGNITQVKDNIILDTTPPSGSILINQDAEFTNTKTVTLYLKYQDLTSGVKEVRYRNEGDTWLEWEEATLTKSWQLQPEDNTKKVYYQIKDNAELVATFTDTIILDTTKPGGILTINNNASYTTSLDVMLGLEYKDNLSGADKVRYSNDAITWTAWEDIASTKIWSLKDNSTGTKYVYCQIKDNSGNISDLIQDAIIYDPTITINIFINQGATYTTSEYVSLYLSWSATPTALAFANEGLVFSNTITPTNIYHNWRLSAGEGLKTVFFKAYYKGKEEVISDSIILDKSKPFGKIFINNQALYTNTKTVSLTIEYEDIISGVELMKLKDEKEETAWIPATTTYTWQLKEEDGIKYVYLKLKDKAGHESDWLSDNIILDTTKPRVRLL
jgi:hypothetical protein